MPEELTLFAFEVECDGVTYYCCLSGGKIVDGLPVLTLVGRAAAEALASIAPKGTHLLIQELKLGKTPIQEKMANAFRRAGANGFVCFIGDMAHELDGHAFKALNVNFSRPQ